MIYYMASIKFTSNSIKKLMEIVDKYKNINDDLDDITYIEISNAIKLLFDKSKVIDDSDKDSLTSLSSLELYSDSDLDSLSTNSSQRIETRRRGTVEGNVRWG